MLDDVDLLRDLGPRQSVGCEIRRHALSHVVEIRRRLIRQAHEYETGECPHVHRLQAPLRRRGLAGGAATDDPALEVVGPAVVRALQGRAGNAAVLLQDARAAMPAGVMEGADRAVVAPQDEDRPGTDLESAVVAALGNFGLAGHEQPVTAEEVFELGRIQPLIGEERTREGETGFAGRQERGHVLPQGLGRGTPRCANGGGGCVRAHGL